MRRKTITAAVLAGVLGVGVMASFPTFAKNQPKQPTAAQRMADYSPPKKLKQSNQKVRISRLKQMNIVGEAATVLHVLPIDIIDEMKKGKTVVQIAQEKGLTEAEFTKKISDLETKTVNAAVSAGVIPKKHADAINSGRSDRLKNAMKEKAMDVKSNMPMDMGN